MNLHALLQIKSKKLIRTNTRTKFISTIVEHAIVHFIFHSSSIKMSIDWNKSINQWIQKILIEILNIISILFEEIIDYIKTWISTNNFNCNLTTKKLQIATKTWTNNDLRQHFQHVWNKILVKTKWHSIIFYDFIRFVVKRESTKMRRIVSKSKKIQFSSFVFIQSTSKTFAKSFLFFLHDQFSNESSFRFSITFASKSTFIQFIDKSRFRFSTIFTSKRTFNRFNFESSFRFATTFTLLKSSTTFISKIVFLIFFHDEIDETNIDVKYIFIDKLTSNASNVIFNNMSIFIKYIILIEMRKIFVERKLNENCQFFLSRLNFWSRVNFNVQLSSIRIYEKIYDERAISIVFNSLFFQINNYCISFLFNSHLFT
jgi:hypothetical protein